MNRTEALEELGNDLEIARKLYISDSRSIHASWALFERRINEAVGKYIVEYDKGWGT